MLKFVSKNGRDVLILQSHREALRPKQDGTKDAKDAFIQKPSALKLLRGHSSVTLGEFAPSPGWINVDPWLLASTAYLSLIAFVIAFVGKLS